MRMNRKSEDLPECCGHIIVDRLYDKYFRIVWDTRINFFIGPVFFCPGLIKEYTP